jgi:hypothetical protein
MINPWSDFYDDLLNEQGSFFIGDLEFLPSDILKNCDPIAYRCGLADFESYMLENAEMENA